jgi:polyphosphate glucokinase
MSASDPKAGPSDDGGRARAGKDASTEASAATVATAAPSVSGAPRARRTTSVTRKAPATPAAPAPGPEDPGPLTLAIDIGGTGLKANVLDAAGSTVGDRVRIPTTYPMAPTGDKGLVETLVRLVSGLPKADRVSAGFPGMVRGGVVMSAPHFVTTKGPGSAADPKLVAAWDHFDLTGALSDALGRPTRVANDADVQGLAVVVGEGFEVVLTLGTGFGSATFADGALLPHLELAHQPFRKGETYNDQLGEAARRAVGNKRWNARVARAVANVQGIFFYDHIYLGGGNAARVTLKSLGELGAKLSLVDNSAGILGGIKLWDERHMGL